MKKIRIMALLLAGLMAAGSLCACDEGGDQPAPDRETLQDTEVSHTPDEDTENKGSNETRKPYAPDEKDTDPNDQDTPGNSDSSADPSKYVIDSFKSLSEGIISFEAHNSYGTGYGYINSKGTIIVPPIYEEASPFFNGLARVKSNGKYGYIGKTGEIVLPCIYDSADEKFDVLSMVSITSNGKTSLHYINVNGDYVYTATGDEKKIGDYQNGFFWVETEKITISGNAPTLTYYNEQGEVAFAIPNARNSGNLSHFNEHGYAFVITRTDGEIPESSDDYFAQRLMIDQSGQFVDWIFEGIDSHYDSLQPYNTNYMIFNAALDSGDSRKYYVDYANKTKIRTSEGMYNTYIGHFYSYHYPRFEAFKYQDIETIWHHDQPVLRLNEIDAFGNASINRGY